MSNTRYSVVRRVCWRVMIVILLAINSDWISGINGQEWLAKLVPGVGVITNSNGLSLSSTINGIPEYSLGVGTILVVGSYTHDVSSNSISWEIKYPERGWISMPLSSVSSPSSLSQLVDEFALRKQLEFLPYENCSPDFATNIHVLYACAVGNYWMRNWPIGTGEIGALVGGTPGLDRIPIAISDLFVGNKKSIVTTFHDFIHAAGSSHDEFKIATRFQEATELLASGDIGPVGGKAGTMETINRAQFEFMGDIMISYLNVDLSLAGTNSHRQLFVAPQKPLQKPPQRPKPHPRTIPMNMQLGNNPGVPVSAQRMLPSGQKHTTLLNLELGTAADTYILGGKTIHHREWIGSQKWNVVMGRLSCSLISTNIGCLSFELSLMRPPNGPRETPMMRTTGYNSWSVQVGIDKRDKVTINRLGMAIFSSDDALTAYSFMCVAVVCHEQGAGFRFPSPVSKGNRASFVSSNISQAALDSYLNNLSKKELLKESKETSITCSVRDADIFVSITKESNDEALLRELRKAVPQSHNSGVEERCWKNIIGAIRDVGAVEPTTPPTRTFDAHSPVNVKSKLVHEPNTESFPELYNRMRVVLNPEHLRDIKFNMSGSRSIGEDDLHIKDIKDDLSVVTKLVPLLAVGRFMFLAGATKGPSNLQGAWADGRESSWSGDYHLNINMQMQYWPMDSFRLHETIPPLLDFIKRLTHNGQITAQAMYHCPGWVAHGYTDGFVITGMGGAPHWALCVTCGAWLVLHVWDHFTYDIDLPMLRDHLLPAFEGIAQFFSNYLIPCNEKGQCQTKLRSRHKSNTAVTLAALYHTGPTGSPENMYSFTSQGGKNGHSAVSFTPAIDSSVLRQTASAYALASALLLQQYGLDPKTSPELIQRAKDHSALAQQFKSMIKRLPYGALPVASKAGGILEYPTPLLNDYATDAIDGPVNAKTKIGEEADKGHRHFSHMHWLYPGVFLPKAAHRSNGGDSVSLYAAAKGAMQRRGASGHTGWSAAWQAALWARIWKGKEAWVSIKRLVNRYTTDRYLTLHPKLMHSHGPMTAFIENTGVGSFNSINEVFRRSMVTNNGAMFQFDANMGILAAFAELILQTHIPGIVTLLPALPPALKLAGGTVDGMAGRGNIIVSVQWQGCSAQCDIHHHRHGEIVGAIISVTITAVKPHPWYAQSPDFELGGASVIKSPVNSSTTGDLAGRKLASRTRDKPGIRIGGMVEDADAGGFFSWSDNAIKGAYSMDSSARTDGPFGSTVDDMVIVYPRTAQKHLLLTSSEVVGANAGELACAHLLRLSDAVAAASPELHVNSLSAALLGDYVGDAKAAHFNSIAVRVSRFPCKMTFSPER